MKLDSEKLERIADAACTLGARFDAMSTKTLKSALAAHKERERRQEASERISNKTIENYPIDKKYQAEIEAINKQHKK